MAEREPVSLYLADANDTVYLAEEVAALTKMGGVHRTCNKGRTEAHRECIPLYRLTLHHQGQT